MVNSVYCLMRYVVGGLEHEFYFPQYIGIIIPTGLSYVSEGLKPPTRYSWQSVTICFSIVSINS